MHLFHKNEVERTFKTDSDRLNRHPSPFLLLPPFCSTGAQARKAERKEHVVPSLGQLMGPGIFQNPHVGCVAARKRGRPNFLIRKAF